MSKAKHGSRWHEDKRYLPAKTERRLAKMKKVNRKRKRERERRDKRVTECYANEGHSACGRKSRFKNRQSALKYIERHYSKSPLYVYKCPYCGGWHLTSHPRARRDGGELTVREILDAARDAALQIRRIEEELELKQQAIGPQGYSVGPHSKNGILDPMRKVDEMLDAQHELADVAELQEPLDEAWDVVRGIEKIADSLTVELVIRYYLHAESWSVIARDLSDNRHVESLVGITRSEQIVLLSKTMDVAISQWEQTGIAHLREMGR